MIGHKNNQYSINRFLQSTQILLRENGRAPFLSIFSDIGKVSNDCVCHDFGIELGSRQFRMAKNLLHGRDWNALVA